MEKVTPIAGSRFWREFHVEGCVHADMSETVASQLEDPRAWIEHTLGGTTNFIRPENLKRPQTDDVETQESTRTFATAPSSHFPPNLQLFIVPPDSEAKLILELLDSWTLLQEAENRSADFYLNLFGRIRIMRFEKSAFIAPTFSTINGRLIFVQPPKLGEKDKMGERVQNWVSNREPTQLQVMPGEMLMVDNHRYAKKINAQSRLEGVESYSVWTEQVTSHPAEKHLVLAKKFKEKLIKVFPVDDEKMLMRFGLAEKPLGDYVRAFLDTPTRFEELMPIYKQVFNELYDA
jgi:hypothetical protein